MSVDKILESLTHPNAVLMCTDVAHKKDKKRYRVPVRVREVHGIPLDTEAMRSLGNSLVADQLRVVYDAYSALGLLLPKFVDVEAAERDGDELDVQFAMGGVILSPPSEWAALKHEMLDWFFDGVDSEFEGLPYSFDDITVFAMRNFSPDRWFTVTRGPAAGGVYFWGHDGDSEMEEPWATDIRAWEARILANVEDALGGVYRFSAGCCEDDVHEDAELYPEEYQSGQ